MLHKATLVVSLLILWRSNILIVHWQGLPIQQTMVRDTPTITDEPGSNRSQKARSQFTTSRRTNIFREFTPLETRRQ